MVDRRPRMRRSHQNRSILILTCLIQMSDGSRMTHLIWCVRWIRLQPYLSIVSPYFSSDPFPEHRLSPTSASHHPGCCQKSTPELHFCSGAAIGSHHSSPKLFSLSSRTVLAQCGFLCVRFWWRVGQGTGIGRGQVFFMFPARY
jgi:hypothetical protein